MLAGLGAFRWRATFRLLAALASPQKSGLPGWGDALGFPCLEVIADCTVENRDMWPSAHVCARLNVRAVCARVGRIVAAGRPEKQKPHALVLCAWWFAAGF